MIETLNRGVSPRRTASQLRVAMVLAAAASGTAGAGDLRVAVVDARGQPAVQVVVLARPVGNVMAAASAKSVTVTQQMQSFTPSVTPISVGTTVQFPNLDRMRHHVYSFSQAKTFEIHLYSGEEIPKVTFDVPGPVSLGCNIHDWMSGYLYVTDAPYFASTDGSGNAALGNLPPGEYRLSVWHPKLNAETAAGTTQVGAAAATADIKVAATIETLAQHRPDDDPLLLRLRAQNN